MPMAAPSARMIQVRWKIKLVLVFLTHAGFGT